MLDGRKVCDWGDFVCLALAGEKEKECLGGRLPLKTLRV